MPNLQIVSAFPQLSEFAASVEETDLTALNDRYRAQIIAPVWEAVVAGGEIAKRGEPLFTMSFNHLDQLATGARAVCQSSIEEVIGATFQDCAEQLSGPDTAIGIVPADPANELVRNQMHGVLGWVPGGGRIVLFLIPDTVPDWLDWVRYTVAHEYHHSVWRNRNPDYGHFSLLEYLIFEGRADNFARSIVPAITPPWIDMLSDQQQREVWAAMLPQLMNRDREQVLPFIFGGSDIPQWAGYTMGYRIVQRFLLRFPNMPAIEWTDLSAQEILDKSEFDANQRTR